MERLGEDRAGSASVEYALILGVLGTLLMFAVVNLAEATQTGLVHSSELIAGAGRDPAASDQDDQGKKGKQPKEKKKGKKL